MALEYGFTQKERETYFLPEKVYSSFGRDNTDDFVSLCVYSMGDELLDEISIDISDIDVPKHLRDNGFTEGTYKVVYKFLRRLAGVEDFVFVDGKGVIYEGKVQTKVINGVERFFIGTTNPNIDEQDKHKQLIVYLNQPMDRQSFTVVLDENESKIAPRKYRGVSFGKIEHYHYYPKVGDRYVLIFTYR